MAVHRMFQDGLMASEGALVVLGGEEAHHAARVKRVVAGEGVEVLNGAGLVMHGRVEEVRKKLRGEGWEVLVRVEGVRVLARVSPRVEVWSAVPKGDRFEEMVDQLAQVGVAEWSPLHVSRGVVEPRGGKMDRVMRRAMEASKQCGRAWKFEIGAGGGVAEALTPGSAGGHVVIADASGSGYRPSGAGQVRVLVGPEGGWSEEELERARQGGAQVAAFGPHVMRIETAAVVAAAVVMDAERRG